MKNWIKGGLIGLATGYIGYIIVYLFMKYRLPVLTDPSLASIAPPTLLGSIPSFGWFIVYSLIFFLIGFSIALIIQKIKSK
ncbi:MAG: hypothetical protein JW924_02820 [Fusobacteriaceae bacterium]|nr:hypothetical protein [Fusobacteriaceae bacterium]